jgi:hypothetical protein
MYKESLSGTIGAYDRHVFLCYKSPEAWPSRVEGPESDSLPKLLYAAFKARKNDMALKVSFIAVKKSVNHCSNYDFCCDLSSGLRCRTRINRLTFRVIVILLRVLRDADFNLKLGLID